MIGTARRQCKSCGAAIVWARTASGKLMPVDLTPSAKGNLSLTTDVDGELRVLYIDSNYNGRRYRPHFATCPDADGWRKR